MILTLTGASGAGKTTIAKELLINFTIYAQMVPSYTTRKPRETDIYGEYKYVSKLRFKFLKKIGAFLWTVHVHGNKYGTTKSWVVRALQEDGVIYIMILTPDAIKTLRDFAEEKSFLSKICSFYVYSPPQEVLRKRLESRGDNAKEVAKRLADCCKWDRDAVDSGIPYEFVRNDNELQETVTEIKNCFLMRIDGCDCYF